VWGGVAALAARAPADPGKALLAALQPLRAAVLGRDGAYRAERRLLVELALRCENRVLAREALRLRRLVERALAARGIPHRGELALAVHRRLVEAVDSADPSGARDAIHRHSRFLRADLLGPARSFRATGERAASRPRAEASLRSGRV
jgi:DNA-binding FadR family transcriptional regulator